MIIRKVENLERVVNNEMMCLSDLYAPSQKKSKFEMVAYRTQRLQQDEFLTVCKMYDQNRLYFGIR